MLILIKYENMKNMAFIWNSFTLLSLCVGGAKFYQHSTHLHIAHSLGCLLYGEMHINRNFVLFFFCYSRLKHSWMNWVGRTRRAIKTNGERRISAFMESNRWDVVECLVHETVIMSCQSFCCRRRQQQQHRRHRHSCCFCCCCYFCEKDLDWIFTSATGIRE